MRFLPTRVHGVLDYLSAITLFALPSMMRDMTSRTANLVMFAAIAVLAVSLLTRYELGLLRVIPMRAHLAIDLLLGIVILAYTWTMSEDPGAVRGILTALGIYSLGSALLTHVASSVEAEAANARERRAVASGDAP